MGKHWARQQAKTNDLGAALASGVEWLRANRQTAGLGMLIALLAVTVAGGSLYRNYARQQDAWNKLSVAQALAYSGFADRALEEVKAIASTYPGTQAEAYAALFAADVIHFPRAQYKEASAAYNEILEKGEPKPLQPLALLGLGVTQEAAGLFKEGAATQQRFLDTYSDHFLAPEAHASLARCLMGLGQAEQAKTTLQKIALQYPDTPWSAWAQHKTGAK